MNPENKILWLRSRGGRTTNDVLEDKCGEYVLMGDGKGKEVKIYLPKKFKWVEHRPIKEQICKKEI